MSHTADVEDDESIQIFFDSETMGVSTFLTSAYCKGVFLLGVLHSTYGTIRLVVTRTTVHDF